MADATDPDEVGEASWTFLRELPAMVEFDTPQGRLLLCHGIGPDDMAGVHPFDHAAALNANDALQALLQQDRYTFVINGHTHRRMVRAVGSLTLINAGTLLTTHGAGCVVVDFESQTVRLYDVGNDGSVNEVERVDV